MSTREILLQASAVAINGYALLIEGQPGSGKSTLALELIDRGALLIGDDGVKLSREGETVIASPPPNIAGLIEIRGVGLASIDCVTAPVALGISLVDEAERVLYHAMQAAREDILPLVEERAYGAAMRRLAELRTPVDAFFDDVMVMADDEALRSNRLALLAELRSLFLGVADISRLTPAVD